MLTALAGLPIIPVRTEILEELITGLSLCDVAVFSDGGAMHIAAALGKTVVRFFGNSDAGHWYPWGVSNELLQKLTRDVADISVDEAAAFRRLYPQIVPVSQESTESSSLVALTTSRRP